MTESEQVVMDTIRADPKGEGRFMPGSHLALVAESLVDDGVLDYDRGVFRLPPTEKALA